MDPDPGRRRRLCVGAPGAFTSSRFGLAATESGLDMCLARLILQTCLRPLDETARDFINDREKLVRSAQSLSG